MMLKKLGIVLLVCVLLISTVSAGTFHITANPSETGIVWTWDTGSVVDIYVDGEAVATGTSNNHWYLSHLHGQESHEIEIKSTLTGTTLGISAVSTLHPEWVVLLLIVILFILLFTTILLRGSPVMVIVIGAISVAIALYTGQISTGYGGITIIPYILAVIEGGLIVLAFWEIIIEKTQWG